MKTTIPLERNTAPSIFTPSAPSTGVMQDTYSQLKDEVAYDGRDLDELRAMHCIHGLDAIDAKGRLESMLEKNMDDYLDSDMNYSFQRHILSKKNNR